MKKEKVKDTITVCHSKEMRGHFATRAPRHHQVNTNTVNAVPASSNNGIERRHWPNEHDTAHSGGSEEWRQRSRCRGTFSAPVWTATLSPRGRSSGCFVVLLLSFSGLAGVRSFTAEPWTTAAEPSSSASSLPGCRPCEATNDPSCPCANRAAAREPPDRSLGDSSAEP